MAEEMHDYLYGTKEEREQTATELLQRARNARISTENDWRVYSNYYNGKHDSPVRDSEIDNEAPSISEEIGMCDAYTQIESQIDTTVPEPVFSGREKSDTQKAKQREYVVKSIIYKNRLGDKMTKNERSMRLYGDSFMKVYFDINADFDGGEYEGDIVVDCLDTEDIYPDPSADCLDNCEYVDYVYRIHKRKAMRIWGKEIAKADIDTLSLGGSGQIPTTTMGKNLSADEVEIQEHWYRDDDGDIACSILIDGREIKFIEKYWEATASQNKRYPFVHFYRIKNIIGFWNQSELKAIIPMIKAGDTILQSALKNMEYSSNDMMVVEPENLIDSEEVESAPGAMLNVKKGTSSTAIRRLGGINNLGEFLIDLQYIQGEIQKTCRNYETNQGKETDRQNTASGLAMLRADAAAQTSIKDADRLGAFKRLFELIDWTALEYYDDDRLVYLGTPNRNNRADMATGENLDPLKGDIFFRFNNSKVSKTKNANVDGNTKLSNYYPAIDVEVNATAGIQKSKTYTIQTLQALLQTQVTQANYKIVVEIIRETGIPQAEELISDIEAMYSPNRGSGNADLDKYISQLAPGQQATIRSNPTLMKQLMKEYTSAYGGNVYDGGTDSAGTASAAGTI